VLAADGEQVRIQVSRVNRRAVNGEQPLVGFGEERSNQTDDARVVDAHRDLCA